MVSKDTTVAGAGSNSTCVKQQKNLMNSLSSSTDYAQRSANLYSDSYRTAHVLPATLGAPTLQTRPQPEKQALGHPDPRHDPHEEMTSKSESASNGLRHPASDDAVSQTEDSLLDGSAGIVDSSNMASSEDVGTLACMRVDVRVDAGVEAALIDEDDDDMSLRERTVTDVSAADGTAAELVGGRLTSISSESSHSAHGLRPGGGDSSEATALPEEEEEPLKKAKRLCCHCTIL